jgi:hypothetical protein
LTSKESDFFGEWTTKFRNLRMQATNGCNEPLLNPALEETDSATMSELLGCP